MRDREKKSIFPNSLILRGADASHLVARYVTNHLFGLTLVRGDQFHTR